MVTSKAHRMITGAFGIFLIGVAFLTFLFADAGLAAIFVALVLALLGADALASAIRDKRSIVSRIGPLP